MWESQVPVWMVFRSRIVITADGDELAADAELRIPAAYGIQKSDLVEDVEDLGKYYRVEQLEEIVTSTGRVSEHSCILLRDNSHEPSS